MVESVSKKDLLCNVCGNTAAIRLSGALDPLSKERFTVLGCRKCGHGQTSPTPEDIGKYYGERYYGGRHSFTARWCAWRRMRVVSQAFHPGKPGKILDLGCGDGSFLTAAKREGWKVYGTELNPKEMLDSTITVYETTEAARKEGPFGCITMWHSLEHFPDPIVALHDLRQMLTPGGILMIAVPNAAGAQARVFGKYWFAVDVPRHLQHFSEASHVATAKANGFTLKRMWHHEAEYDVFGWMQSALNKVFTEPNILFEMLTGRPVALSSSGKVVQLFLGGLLFPIAFVATVLTTWAGSGGTLLACFRDSGNA